MDASEFSKELDKALGLCRAAAELKLEQLVHHLGDTLMKPGITSQQRADTENLITILYTVGEGRGDRREAPSRSRTSPRSPALCRPTCGAPREQKLTLPEH